MRRRRAVLVVVPVAVVVAALVVIVLLVHPGSRRPVTTPVAPTAAPSAGPPAFVVSDDRHVTFEELSVALPGEPYFCSHPLPTPPAGFDAYVSCDAVVHEDFDGLGSSWGSRIGVVLLDDSLARPGDLGRSAKEAFRNIYRASFSAHDSPTLSDEVGEPVAVHGPAGVAYRHRARVHVDPEDLGTTSDLLSVEVVRLRSGRVAAVFVDLPDDAQRAVLRAAAISQVSVSVH